MPREPKECCGSKGPTCKKDCVTRVEEAPEPVIEEAPVSRTVLTSGKEGQFVVQLEGKEAHVVTGKDKTYRVIRTYSDEIHGEAYQSLAESFTNKQNS